MRLHWRHIAPDPLSMPAGALRAYQKWFAPFAVRIASRSILMSDLPSTLGNLRNSNYSEQRIGLRTVKDELRENLICKLQKGEDLFPGVVGYDDTVVPQIVNAVLSRHNFILLGLRGQAKTRIIRMLTELLDDHLPYIEG